MPKYKPTHEEIIQRYKASIARDKAAKNTIFKVSVHAIINAAGSINFKCSALLHEGFIIN